MISTGLFNGAICDTWSRTFKKLLDTLQEVQFSSTFDLIYYDAFGPTYQAEMWELPQIQKIASLMTEGSVLVSYCAQGQFRRNLVNCGLKVERLEGPPGKREMTRAIK